ncbi:MAG: hypothetical protein JWM95_1414 [Gemmatimonadetes bacterium]|nr:hypothetical protein [Gemmatimonadota bacterium]
MKQEHAAHLSALRSRACKGNPYSVRYGESLPECAGALAYFTLGVGALGPARTFMPAVKPFGSTSMVITVPPMQTAPVAVWRCGCRRQTADSLLTYAALAKD